MKQLITVTAIAVLIHVTNAQQLGNCEIGPRDADRCAKTLLFEGDRNRFVPRSDQDMDRHCR